MRPFAPLSIAAFALLAGCHAGGGGNETAAVNTVDPIEAKIVAFPEPLRQTTFFRAIRDANFDCQQVVKEESRPRDNGRPVWLVACDNGQQFVLTLAPGGIFQVSGVPKAGTE